MDRMAFTLCAGGGAANLSLLCRLLDTQPSLASCTDEAGNWLLHVAAANGHADVCASLISREEGRRLVESVNAQGKTPLDVAADDVVRSLLSPPGSANPATASAEGAVEGAAEGDANEDADVIMSLSTLPEDLGIAILLQLDGACVHGAFDHPRLRPPLPRRHPAFSRNRVGPHAWAQVPSPQVSTDEPPNGTAR